MLWRRDESLDDIVAAMTSYGAPAAAHLETLRGVGGELAPALRSNATVARLTEQAGRLAKKSAGGSRRGSERRKSVSRDAPDARRFAAGGLPIVANRAWQPA